jgi:hypothetical protein
MIETRPTRRGFGHFCFEIGACLVIETWSLVIPTTIPF